MTNKGKLCLHKRYYGHITSFLLSKEHFALLKTAEHSFHPIPRLKEDTRLHNPLFFTQMLFFSFRNKIIFCQFYIDTKIPSKQILRVL